MSSFPGKAASFQHQHVPRNPFGDGPRLRRLIPDVYMAAMSCTWRESGKVDYLFKKGRKDVGNFYGVRGLDSVFLNRQLISESVIVSCFNTVSKAVYCCVETCVLTLSLSQ